MNANEEQEYKVSSKKGRRDLDTVKVKLKVGVKRSQYDKQETR